MAKLKARDKPRQRNRPIKSPPKFKKQPQKQSKPPPAPKPTIPFDVYDDTLLIGEGDFSFAASLAADHGATSLLATTLEDEATCHAKHPSARTHLASIAAAFDDPREEQGQEEKEGEKRVLYAVDATQLHKHKLILRRRPWKRVVFNFPHVGGRSTDVNRQVRANQALLAGFFASAQQLLLPPSPLLPGADGDGNWEERGARGGGENVNGIGALAQPTILVTLFEAEPYTLWNVRDLARHAGLVVLRSFRFPAEAYPTYRHARTLGVVLDKQGKPSESAWKGEERAARMYEFGLKPAENHGEQSRTKKKAEESSDDDD